MKKAVSILLSLALPLLTLNSCKENTQDTNSYQGITFVDLNNNAVTIYDDGTGVIFTYEDTTRTTQCLNLGIHGVKELSDTFNLEDAVFNPENHHPEAFGYNVIRKADFVQ